MRRRPSPAREDLRRQLDAALRAQQEAEQASQAKTRFLARMSHDLLTPLNAMIGFPDLLIEGHFGALNDRQQHAVENVREAARQLRQQLQDLLELARLDGGELEIDRSPVELGGLLAEALEVTAAAAARRRVTLAGDLAPRLPLVLGDAVRLRRLVLGLLDNALKHTPGGGEVRLRSWSSPRPGGTPWVRLAVADSGTGLAREDCERIFLLFEQLGACRPDRPSGSGLGLALARRIVALHGGRVWAESPGVGAGSTFHVELPGLEEPAEAGR